MTPTTRRGPGRARRRSGGRGSGSRGAEGGIGPSRELAVAGSHERLGRWTRAGRVDSHGCGAGRCDAPSVSLIVRSAAPRRPRRTEPRNPSARRPRPRVLSCVSEAHDNMPLQAGPCRRWPTTTGCPELMTWSIALSTPSPVTGAKRDPRTLRSNGLAREIGRGRTCLVKNWLGGQKTDRPKLCATR